MSSMIQSNIQILWNCGEKWHRSPYYYKSQRVFNDKATLFYKNCVLTLDFLYDKKALELEFEDGTTVNILEEFINRPGKKLSIRDGEKNMYNPSIDTIMFYDNAGAMFRKNLNKPWSKHNTGRVSSASLLGHEIIHAYHDQFTPQEYLKRKNKKVPRWKVRYPHFPNAEEILVTKDLGNQVIEKLGEDRRKHYKRNYYLTKSPITTAPMPVDQDDEVV